MTSLEELARELAELRRQVNRMTPQLASSSIETGAIREHDVDGALVGQYGRQFDGTSAPSTFNGPLPPMPSTPVLTPVVKGVKVRWDGLFADDEDGNEVLVPMNFARVELHASTDAGFLADTAATLISTWETPRGGELVVAANPTLLCCRLVTRNLAGLRSPATPVVSATPLGVNDTDIESVGVAKLTTGELAAGQRIILGVESEAHAEATPDGFSVYRVNLENGQLYRSATLGDADVPDMLQIAGADGAVKASISDEGKVVSQELVVSSKLYVGGLDLDERFAREAATRNIMNAIRLADGRITGGELGLFEFQFTAQWGHVYSFVVAPVYIACSGAAYHHELILRFTDDGSRPTVSSPIYYRKLKYHTASGGGWYDMGGHFLNHFPFFWAGGTTGDTRLFRILVTMRTEAGNTVTWANYGDQYSIATVLDHGMRNIGVFAVDNDGGGTGTPPPVPQQYYWEGGAEWGATWRGNGSKRTDTADLYQGYYSGTNGLQHASWGWPDLTGMLSGATVDRAETWLYTPHWYSAGGGVACIGFHSQLGEPADWTGALDVRQYGFARGEGKWIDLNDWKGNIQNGGFRGLAFAPPNTSSTFYGYAAGDGQPGGPVLRIWYTK
jgi:hypothetical protein